VDSDPHVSRLAPATAWLALGLSALVTMAVYGRALGFSYFFDDVMDLAVTEEASFVDLIARPSPGSVYYRPLPYLIWKALYVITGEYDPVILHALPIAAHALSGWLLFLLLRRLTASLWALLPMVLFLLYPFSYQALEILGTLVHTLVTVQLLAALLLWYDGRTRGSPVRLALAGVLSVTALWTHEYGVALLPLLLGLEGLLWWQRRVARPSRWLAVPGSATVVYAMRYVTIDRPQREPTTAADMVHNAGFWLQGFAWPVTRQTVWLTDLLGGDPLRLVLPLGLLGLLAALAYYWRAGRTELGLGLLALGGLVFVPAMLTLTYEYMQNGPRLLYVASPAAATFWGLLPWLRVGDGRVQRAWQFATVALVGIVVVQSVLFVERRMEMLDYGTELHEQIIALGEDHAEQAVLILNAPSWFAPKTQEFPRGHLGIQLQPAYAGYDRLIYVGSGLHVQAESRSLAPDVNGWHWNFDPHGPFIGHPELDERLRAGVPVYIVDLYHDRMALRQVGTISPGQASPNTWEASFGERLLLLDHTIRREGTLLRVQTRWYVAASLPGDERPHYQLVAADGRVLLTHARYALSDMGAPRLWQPGDIVEDEFVLDLRRIGISEPFTVRLALVDNETGNAMDVFAPAGVQDQVWLVLE
jgi:hypothetical protein